MAWDPNKPANADLVFNSVGSTAIRNNFSAIDTAWDINHVGIGDTNQGKHSYVHLREGATPTTTTNEIAMFCVDSTLTSYGTELYYRRESNGTVMPITEANRIAGVTGPTLTVGWTMLPSGILLKWGSVNTVGGDANIVFPTTASDKPFTAAYRAFLTPRDSNGGDSDVAIRLMNFTTTTLSYYGSPRTTTGAKAMTFDFLCIGSGV